MQTYPIKLILVVLGLSAAASNAFHVSTPLNIRNRVANSHGRQTFRPLQGMMGPQDFAEDNSFDVEAARQKLESLVGGGGGGGGGSGEQQQQQPQRRSSPTLPMPGRADDPGHFRPANADIFQTLETVRLPKAPPLTSIDRERRQAEIALLARLADGDDALADLWILWFQERGPQAAARLTHAEELSSSSHTWGRAEVLLRELVAEYGVSWVEPVNRLATLYYAQGRLQEAEALHKTVLAIKPWHFGALSGIVMVYAKMPGQVDQARRWAAHRLPTLAPVGPNRRRKQWVEKASFGAQEALQKAEHALQDAFGVKDDHHHIAGGHTTTTSTLVSNEFDDDDDAWQ